MLKFSQFISYETIYGNLLKNFTIEFGDSSRGENSATRRIILKDASGKVFWNSPIQHQQGNGSWKLFMHDIKSEVISNKETTKTY